MIVDSSVLVAILEMEPEAQRLRTVVHEAVSSRLSAAGYLESGIVLGHRRGPEGLKTLDLWLEAAGVVIEPVTQIQALIAREAFMRFGKGRHPAALNFGDCFAYALARAFDEPLLCKGDDFGRTDLALAPY